MAVSNTDTYSFQFLRKTAKALQREVKKSVENMTKVGIMLKNNSWLPNFWWVKILLAGN